MFSEVLHQFDLQKYPPEALIQQAGKPCTALHVIETGQVQLIYSNTPQSYALCRWLGVGDVFGEMALWKEQRYACDVKAMTTTHTRVLPSTEILAVLKNSPEVGLYLASRLAKRLRRAYDMLACCLYLSRTSATTRVAFLLRHLVRQQGEKPGQRKTLTLPLRRDMARMVGLRRSTVSRALTELETRGFITRLGPKRIAVLDPEALSMCYFGGGSQR